MGQRWTDGPEGRVSTLWAMLLFDLEIMIMISNMISFVNRMSWRWKEGEGGETGTRGGAGAAAGEKWRVFKFSPSFLLLSKTLA